QFQYTAFNSNHAESVKEHYGVDIALGMNVLDIFGKGSTSDLIKFSFQKVIAGDAVAEILEIGDTAIATHFYEMKFNPIFDDNGTVVGAAVYGVDFEERQQAERDILQAKIDAEQ